MSEMKIEQPNTIAKEITISFIQQMVPYQFPYSKEVIKEVCDFYEAIYNQIIESDRKTR